MANGLAVRAFRVEQGINPSAPEPTCRQSRNPIAVVIAVAIAIAISNRIFTATREVIRQTKTSYLLSPSRYRKKASPYYRHPLSDRVPCTPTIRTPRIRIGHISFFFRSFIDIRQPPHQPR